MALLFIDGFDHYASANVLLKWSTGSATISTSDPRTGTQSITNYTDLKKVFASGFRDTTYYCGFAFKRNSAIGNSLDVTFLGDSGATTHTFFRFAGDEGTIRAYRNTTGTLLGTSTPACIPPDTWCYIEYKVTLSDAAGVVEARVNGATVLLLTGVDTKNAGTNANFDAIMLDNTGATSLGSMDDFYILNSTGSVNNTFLGDVKVQTLRPTGAGTTTQLTPSAGSNWQCVDENTPNTSDTVSSATDDQYDTYAFGDLSATTGTVAGVQIAIYAQKSDSGAKGVSSVVRHSGTDYFEPSHALGTGYTYSFDLKETNPGTSAAWTPTEINNAEFGVQVKAS